MSNNHRLKEERFNVAHGFRGFSPWPGGSETHIMVEGYGRAKLLLWWPRRAWISAREEEARSQIQYCKSCIHDPPRYTQKCALLPLGGACVNQIHTINNHISA